MVNEKSKLFNLPILCDAWHIVDYWDENHDYDDDDGNDDDDDCGEDDDDDDDCVDDDGCGLVE